MKRFCISGHLRKPLQFRTPFQATDAQNEFPHLPFLMFDGMFTLYSPEACNVKRGSSAAEVAAGFAVLCGPETFGLHARQQR